jgi:hypothetical protein
MKDGSRAGTVMEAPTQCGGVSECGRAARTRLLPLALVPTLAACLVHLRAAGFAAIDAATLQPFGVLEFRKDPALGRGTGSAWPVVQDAAGDVWAWSAVDEGDDTARRLFRRTRDGWEKTPVATARHPVWTARPAPPWQAYPEAPVLLPGEDGSLLVVTLRDVYQEAASAGLLNDSWQAAVTQGEERARRRGRYWWPEGYLHRAGRWTGPLPIDDLLRREFDTIVKAYPLRTHAHAYFDLYADGKHVWTVCDSRVTLHDGRGQPRRLALEWDAGGDKEARRVRPERGPGRSSFVPRGRGTMWCFSPDATAVNEVRLDGERLSARPLPGAGLKSPAVLLHVGRGGELVASVSTSHLAQTQTLILFDETGAWSQQKELGTFLMEDRGGGLWFLPSDSVRRANPTTGYRRVKDGRVTTVPLPGDLAPTGLAAAPGVRGDKDAGGDGATQVLFATGVSFAGPRLGHQPGRVALLLTFRDGAAAPTELGAYSYDPRVGPKLLIDQHGNVVGGGAVAKLPTQSNGR